MGDTPDRTSSAPLAPPEGTLSSPRRAGDDLEAWVEFLSPAERAALGRLCAATEETVAAPYRPTLFQHLLPKVVRRHVSTARVASANHLSDDIESVHSPHPAPRAVLLRVRGRMLLKALVALQDASDQADLNWLTPPEISVYLKKRFGLSGIYRTNVSTVLRAAPKQVDCRARGRAFEYRITASGREYVRRALHLAGI